MKCSRRSTHDATAFNSISLLTDPDFDRLVAWLADYPDVGLRAFGGSSTTTIRDLEFLRSFPRLRRFYLDVYYGPLAALTAVMYVAGQGRRPPPASWNHIHVGVEDLDRVVDALQQDGADCLDFTEPVARCGRARRSAPTPVVLQACASLKPDARDALESTAGRCDW